jgi:hypothetical protein
VFYRSNRYRKDNPRSANGNAAETQQISEITYGSWLAPALWDLMISPPRGRRNPDSERIQRACGIFIAWLIGLPRRAGARVHAANDAEARWQYWHVTERRGGLVRWYRDARFDLPGHSQLQASVAGPDPAAPQSPWPGSR